MSSENLSPDNPGNDPQEPANSEPQMLSTGRAVSLAGLMERVTVEFNAEYEGHPALLSAGDPERREMVRDVVDYVLATESIKLDRANRMQLIELVFNDLFSAGPLEPFLNDADVTEIEIRGHDRLHIRHGAGEMQAVNAQFNDSAHLERFIQRKLAVSGARLGDPFLEVGARFGERPARLTITGAPISTSMHVDIRLHPAQPPTLETIVSSGMLDDSAAATLRAVFAARHGLMVVGDVGTGKTTLLQALLPLLPARSVIVERAPELRPLAGMSQRTVIPQTPERPSREFGAQILAALEERPACLVLDEVRFDESGPLWTALTSDHRPQCVWAFRGATEALRLRTAFSMSVRRAHGSIDQSVIHSALVDRLPFVAFLVRRETKLTLLRIGEWQPESGDTNDLGQIALRQIWPADGATAPRHPL